MKRRAFTLIETSLALAITAMIIGSATLLHAYVLRGLGTASARFSNYRQAQMLVDSIDQVATQAQSYSIVSISGGNYLKLIMPATCSDTDNDGLYDSCVPQRISKRGLEEWGQGKRFWFYLGDGTGTPSTTGTPCAAIVNDDSNPSAATTLTSFKKYSSGQSRFPNIDSVTFSTGGTDYFTVTVTASSNPGELAERKPSGSQDNNLKDSFTVTRIIFTSRWRK